MSWSSWYTCTPVRERERERERDPQVERPDLQGTRDRRCGSMLTQMVHDMKELKPFTCSPWQNCSNNSKEGLQSLRIPLHYVLSPNNEAQRSVSLWVFFCIFKKVFGAEPMSSCINDRRQWKSFSALSQFSFLFSNHLFLQMWAI